MIPIWRRLGYVEGKTLLLRSAEGDPRRLPELVTELIKLEVGVLVAVGPETVRAASQATTSTPIVAIDLETDPVRIGLAASFGRPGGNVTGLFVDQPSLAGKSLQLLREATPQIERVAFVWDPNKHRTGPPGCCHGRCSRNGDRGAGAGGANTRGIRGSVAESWRPAPDRDCPPRVSDHVSGNIVTVAQEKTRKRLAIPVHEDLRKL